MLNQKEVFNARDNMVDAIFIATYAPHVYLTKVLCQSIRFFCGSTIPIIIVPDGPCELSQLKRQLGVVSFDDRQLPARLRELNGYYTKLKILFNTEYKHFLYLDADTILLNDLRNLPFRSYDFFVSGGIEDIRDSETKKRISKLVFDVDMLKEFDADFPSPEILTFNSGHFFATAGIVDTEMLFHCLKYSERCSNNPIFKYYDQGILNYIFNKLDQEKKARVGYTNFALFPSYEPQDKFPELTPFAVLNGEFSARTIIHFTGPTRKNGFLFTSYKWLPRLFQDQYYSSMAFGTREFDFVSQYAKFEWQRLKRKLETLLPRKNAE